jgi:hypothetical protein
MPIGATGTVIELADALVRVRPDSGNRPWGCEPDTLEPILPLTDPRESSWAADKVKKLERLSREPQTLPSELLEEISGGA